MACELDVVANISTRCSMLGVAVNDFHINWACISSLPSVKLMKVLIKRLHCTYCTSYLNIMSIRKTCDFILFDRTLIKQLWFILFAQWGLLNSLWHITHLTQFSYSFYYMSEYEVRNLSAGCQRGMRHCAPLVCLQRILKWKAYVSFIFPPKEKQLVMWWFNFSLRQCCDYPSFLMTKKNTIGKNFFFTHGEDRLPYRAASCRKRYIEHDDSVLNT